MKIILTSLVLVISSHLTAQQNFEYSDDSIAVGQTKRLEVFYRFHSIDLYDESLLALDSLVDFMRLHPNVKIEIGVHNDTRANSQIYSTNYSERRAKEIKRLLTERNINSSRIEYVGYGESRPLISYEAIQKLESDEDKELAHAKNRRTEVKILSL